jgi:hypothetical protein
MEDIKMKREYVIEICGYGKKVRYALRERITPTMLNAAIKVSRSLDSVKTYAIENNIKVVAIGDMYQVMA